ncbi:MAG: FMN-binding protein [Candidatus Binatia bacterium]
MMKRTPFSSAPPSASRRPILLLVVLALGLAGGARADEVYLTPEEAPAAVFPDADRFERSSVEATEDLRTRVRTRLGKLNPTVWERRYPMAVAYRGDEPLGTSIVVEEIGKHRAITFVVGVDPSGEVAGVAVMAYREAYGGEVRSRRFLAQYRGKSAEDALMPGDDVRNLAGATLSARAIGRGVKKAIAVLSSVEPPPLHVGRR